MLFLIGIQLRNNGMTLKQIVLNRRGMIVAVIVVASSSVAGVINALILDLPLKPARHGLRIWLVFPLRYSANRSRLALLLAAPLFFNDLARS